MVYMPVENSTAGSVNRIYDLMKAHKFYIVKSVRIKIDHNLVAKAGTDMSDIKEIFSHEQAVAQCSEFLDQLKGVKVTVCSNTAAAAKMVAESERKDIAAISSSKCAALYGLKELETAIQNVENNYTRFICISKYRRYIREQTEQVYRQYCLIHREACATYLIYYQMQATTL